MLSAAFRLTLCRKKMKALIDKYLAIDLPGFKGVPFGEVLRFVFIEVKRDHIQTRAASIAFNAFLSVFPTIIFIFQLLSVIEIEGMSSALYEFLQTNIPEQAYPFVEETIQNILARQTGGKITLGFLLAIFFASNGMSSLMSAFRKEDDRLTPKKRNFITHRLTAIGLTLLLASVFLLTLAGIIAGGYSITQLANYLAINQGITYLFVLLLKTVLTFLLLLNSISLIYYFAPPVNDKWSYFSPGSIFTSITMILTSLLFSWYLNSFGQYNILYGSLGTIMITMIWMYINSMILLIGFEMNLGIQVNEQKLLESENLL